MAANGANLGSQNDPKSIQNRYRTSTKILIDFWGDLGRPRQGDTIFQTARAEGTAAEAWALPRYLPSVTTIDFEEIVRLYSLNEELFDPLVVSHGPFGGSGRIEDACGESPAASYFGLFPWVKFKLFAHYSFIIRSLFVHYSIFICEHSRIMQRKPSKSDVPVPGAILGSLGSILGSLEAFLGAPEGIFGGLGGLFGRSWGVLGCLGGSWGALGGVLGRSWAVLWRS